MLVAQRAKMNGYSRISQVVMAITEMRSGDTNSRGATSVLVLHFTLPEALMPSLRKKSHVV